jgi:hypothetical protein
MPDAQSAQYGEPEYCGLVNTYADYFRSSVGYCSDSNGYWRYRRLEDVLTAAEDRSLQVLTHPSLWTDEVMSPRQRVLRCVNGRAEKAMAWYDHALKAGGRENVDCNTVY